MPKDSPARILPPDQPYPPVLENPELRKPIVWEGQRFSTVDWIITGAATGIALASNILPPRSSHWTGTNGFDDGARDFLRLSSTSARYWVRDASDVLLSVEVTWPLFVDALIGAWWYHDSPDAAAQMALIDAEAYAVASAIQGTTTMLTSRQRPYGRDCGTAALPETNSDCSSSSVRYRSFFSGHASMSFLGASLICVHHLKLDLFGSRAADIGTCVAAYSGAALSSLFRTMGDVHYTSDILIGATVGTAIGLGLPMLKYRRSRKGILRSTTEKEEGRVMVLPFGAGLGVGGTF